MLFLVFSCNKEDDGLTIEGVYTGYLKSTDHYNGDIFYETDNGKLTISTCSNDCIELQFITDAGSTNAMGTYVKNSSFYTLAIMPVYEIPGNPQPWEEDYQDGAGTFDIGNNELVLNLTVDDSQAIGGSDAVYYFEGKQNE